MKTKFFSMVISLLVLCSCTKTTKPDYLYLTGDQLKHLGFELTDKGIFYKNENPDWNQDNEKYECMAFYCTNDNYITTKHFNVTDTLKASNSTDSLVLSMEFTKNDYYPLLIGNTKGNQSLDNENLPNDMKLLPVAICLSETNLSGRNDTIVVWLRPTESLKKALPSNINMDDYLRTKPVKI